MLDLHPILIRGHETLRTALERINASGRTVLLLVEESGRFLRTVTDGDLRRVILEGGDLDQCLDVLPQRSSWTVPEGTSTEEILFHISASIFVLGTTFAMDLFPLYITS